MTKSKSGAVRVMEIVFDKENKLYGVRFSNALKESGMQEIITPYEEHAYSHALKEYYKKQMRTKDNG